MTIFHDPREFLKHLEKQASQDLSASESKTLLLACCSVIQYLLNSQHMVSGKLISAVACLNDHHETWGHKLSELYEILEAGDVDVTTMNEILQREVHVHKDP